MKKLIIALIVFLAMIGAAIFEIVYTTDTFDELAKLSAAVNERAAVCVEYKQAEERSGEDFPAAEQSKKAESDAKNSINELHGYWQKRRGGALILGNHTVVKSVEEKLASLLEQSNISAWEDASVTAAVLREYFYDLKDDNHLTLTNLF